MARLSSCLAAALLSAVASHAMAQTSSFPPVTDAVLANPDPADWLMLSRTFDQNRFSPLDQINKNNVGQLRMAWTRGLPIGTQEATPIVYRGVIYLNVPGGTVQAINATNGDLIWEYVRDYPKNINPRASRHKNLGIFEDMIYFGAPDGFLVALDAQTGKVRWETKVDDGGHHGRRNSGRRRQGTDQPDLHVPRPRSLLHRGARCSHRQGGLEILHHRGARRARRRLLGQRAGREARGQSVGAAGLL